MKIKYLIYILLPLGLVACKQDYLDREPEANISPDGYFRTEKDLELYCNSFYSVLPSAEAVYNEGIDNIVKNTLADEVTGRRQIPVSGGGWGWSDLRNINYFLENYNNIVPEANAAKYAAVARFFRAYFYLNMVKRFGDVPWYSTALDQNDEAMLTKGRDSRVLIVDSILADLDYAILHLDETNSDEKITKWTALALQSRAALFEGTFRKYHKDLNLPNATSLLEKSAAAAKAIMDGGKYSLYQGDGTNGYQALFSSVNAVNQEVILARKFSDALQIWHDVNYYTITASYGKPGLDKDLVNT